MDKLLNKRYAALYPTVFMTYRRDTGLHGIDGSQQPLCRACRGAPACCLLAAAALLLHLLTSRACNAADDSPSKVWPISAGTTVSDVKGQKCVRLLGTICCSRVLLPAGASVPDGRMYSACRAAAAAACCCLPLLLAAAAAGAAAAHLGLAITCRCCRRTWHKSPQYPRDDGL